MSQRVEFKAGEIFMLTEGSYSDFRNICLLRAKVDLNLKEQRAAYEAAFVANPATHNYRPNPVGFAGFMTALDLIEDVDHTEVWCGDYDLAGID